MLLGLSTVDSKYINYKCWLSSQYIFELTLGTSKMAAAQDNDMDNLHERRNRQV